MKTHIFIICVLAALLAGCSRHGAHNPESAAAQTRNTKEAWEQALLDSITSIQARHDEVAAQADSMKTLLRDLLPRFEIVQDPMLVEPYRVAKGWTSHDTMGKQGILARALEDGTIEIVVTAAGDFSSITLAADGESVQSQNVPSGDALHTTTAGLTRVAFNNAGALARFVHDHAGAEVTLTCGTGKEFRLNDAQKRMMADTYSFASLQASVHELDREQTVLYNKLLLCNSKLDELKGQQEKQK